MRLVPTILVIAGSVASALWAQTPAFEVATVKVNRTGNGSSNLPRLTNGRLTAQNVTLKSVLQVAYGVSALQISGPAWIDTDRYDLEARSPEGIPDSALMPMLQSLVKDRFRMAAHRETKITPVFDLVVTKGGVKFSAFDPSKIPPPPPRNGAASMIIGPTTMDQLAGNLTRAAGRPVLNKTHLEGRYFCAVTFSPLSAQANGDAITGALDIFAAVEQQLGLRMEPSKEPLEFLVIDNADPVPVEN